MAKVLGFLIRYFSNYYTLHRSDLAARAAPLDLRLILLLLYNYYNGSEVVQVKMIIVHSFANKFVNKYWWSVTECLKALIERKVPSLISPWGKLESKRLFWVKIRHDKSFMSRISGTIIFCLLKKSKHLLLIFFVLYKRFFCSYHYVIH